MAPVPRSRMPPETHTTGETTAYYCLALVCSGPRGYREAIVINVATTEGVDTPNVRGDHAYDEGEAHQGSLRKRAC
ncbi:hypothetical protein V7S43_015109 [Phytophthora oleae]|uniref:Uncharacterized protein n=1 Tax=Phytophthora oleae TaxID=2107226 RepID=A0ABD3F050_9STRA